MPRQPVIAYKVKNFPALSESFVLHNIGHSISEGFEVKIIADQIFGIENAAVPEIVTNNDLLSRSYTLNVSGNALKRILKGLWFIIRPSTFRFGLKYMLLSRSLKPKLGYELEFYKQFRDASVIHVHFADNLEPLLALKKIGFLKASLVVTFHGYDAFELAGKTGSKKTIHDYKLFVDAVTVNSMFLKNKLMRIGFEDSNISVIPMGVDGDSFTGISKKQGSEDELRLVTVGRLIPLKGQEYGIRTVKNLVEKGLNVVYTIIGYGPELDRLRSLASELEVSDRVRFTGKLNHSEIKQMFKEQDIFLMTSVADPTDGRREAFGLTSLEAQASGLPVIAFDSGGVRETLIDGTTGKLVSEGDFDAMAGEIEMIFRDKEKYRQMSLNAIEHAKSNFEIRMVNKHFMRLYRELKQQ